MLETLENRDFMNLWLGQLLSRLGDGIHEIALAWLILELTGSAISMGAILAVSVTPNLLFGLPAGIIPLLFAIGSLTVLAAVATFKSPAIMTAR